MRQDKYSGYPITLHSALSAEECLRRLDAEFYDKRGNWHHPSTDKRLLGWCEEHEFVIFPSWRFNFFEQTRSFSGNGGWDTSRVCRIRFRSAGNGCTIGGTYRYARGEQFLIQLTIGLCLGFIVGILFIISGFVGLFTTVGAIWFLIIGVAILAACIALILDRSDGDLPQERDYIASFLARVLEAEPVTESKPVPRPGVRGVR